MWNIGDVNLTDIVEASFPKVAAAAVGALLTWLAVTLHVVVNPASEPALIAFCVAVLTALWVLLVKLIERVWPAAAILLGDRPARPARDDAGRASGLLLTAAVIGALLVATTVYAIAGSVAVASPGWNFPYRHCSELVVGKPGHEQQTVWVCKIVRLGAWR